MSAGDSRLSLAAAGAHRNILLKPVPAMLRLLQSVGVEGDTFTWEQAHHYVGQYIKRRQLYDVERPYLVRCGGDPLGEVFGVEGFSLRDPRHSVAALFVKSFSIVTADSRSLWLTDDASPPASGAQQHFRGRGESWVSAAASRDDSHVAACCPLRP
ncbi:protein Mdm4-like [Petromyzon marinus]|uniref:protein Mdm4-like n=1 Tax=Petromyzon marinus TaxID=7757 RepID=UPI003F6F7E33